MTTATTTDLLGTRQQGCLTEEVVREAAALIDDAAIASILEERLHAARRSRAGRPPTLTVRTVLIGLLLAAAMEGTVRLTTVSELLHYRLPPATRSELGVPDRPDTARGREAGYTAVRRWFHRIVDLMDDSPRPKNRRIPEAEQAALRRPPPPDAEARRELRLWCGNRLVAASLSIEILAKLAADPATGTCVDATPIKTHARGPSPRTGMGSTDPDAGWYTRSSSRHEPDQDSPVRPTTKKTADKSADKLIYGYEITLAVNGSTHDTNDENVLPVLVQAYTLEKPGHRPGPAAIDALRHASANGSPSGLLAGDRAYNNSDPNHFQLPARALGYQPLFDYKSTQLGIQAEHEGALQIEGTWYCPEMPQPLIETTRRYRDGEIAEADWRAALERRRTFELRRKQAIDDEGHQRTLCPAAEPSSRVNCPRKPASMGNVRQLTIHPEPGPAAPPPVCSQKSLTIPPEVGAKHAQALPYGTPEWERAYHTLRNGIEGMNGQLKDPAGANLENSRTRCIRGHAATHLLVGFQLAAANLRKQHDWQATHPSDPHTPARRRPRPRRRTTTPLTQWAPTV